MLYSPAHFGPQFEAHTLNNFLGRIRGRIARVGFLSVSLILPQSYQYLDLLRLCFPRAHPNPTPILPKFGPVEIVGEAVSYSYYSARGGRLLLLHEVKKDLLAVLYFSPKNHPPNCKAAMNSPEVSSWECRSCCYGNIGGSGDKDRDSSVISSWFFGVWINPTFNPTLQILQKHGLIFGIFWGGFGTIGSRIGVR